jgi:pimeloyl-ACP methyl ester carboxylesterase
MATFVLVHGGDMSTDSWNRVTGRHDYPAGGHLGARYWDGTITWLEDHGHRAFAPTLADEHDHNLTDHIALVMSLVVAEDLTEIVLVGHSYGGMVITGVAAEMPGRIGRLVYVDAALPDPGQSLFDLFAAAGANPLSFIGVEAAMAYVQKLEYNPATISGIQKTYIFCTMSEFAGVTRIARRKISAHREGWSCFELPTSHVPMATMPEQFCQLLGEVGKQ